MASELFFFFNTERFKGVEKRGHERAREGVGKGEDRGSRPWVGR